MAATGHRARAIPLLLVFIPAWVDKQWVVRKGSNLHAWRDPAHYGLVVVGTLIAIYAVRASTAALGAALEGYLGYRTVWDWRTSGTIVGCRAERSV